MILVGKPERRPLRRPRRRWIILKWILKIGWSGMKWADLAQDRDEWGAVVNIKCWQILE
jgi:hypothetical protein